MPGRSSSSTPPQVQVHGSVCAACKMPCTSSKVAVTLCCGSVLCAACSSSSRKCPVCKRSGIKVQVVGTASRLPLSGSEPAFSLMPWGTQRGVTGSNCYDYSLNDYRNHRPVKTTPGDKAWDAPTRLMLRQHAKYDRCQDVVPGILADNPGSVYREAAWNPCKQGYSKIQAYVGSGSDGGYGDFHFYRQNKDVEYVTEAGDTPAKVARFFGVPVERVLTAAAAKHRDAALPAGTTLLLKDANVWSHKAGWATGALLKDSCGKAIHDPRRACRSHAVDYTKYCGSYCVKVGATTTATASKSKGSLGSTTADA